MYKLSILFFLLQVYFFLSYPLRRIKNTHKCRTIGFSGLPPPKFPNNISPLFNFKDDSEGNNSDSLNKYENPNENNPLKKFWMGLSEENKEDVKSTTVSLLIAILIRCFIVEPRFIPSLSMFPTFDIGDQLLVDKVSRLKNYHRRDVVVFNPSQNYIELTGNTEALIKRVVGIAGDVIEVKNNKVIVNGVEQDEPYTNENPDYSLPPQQVPEGMLLVLGDNRNHSFDSHLWGFLPSENVIGRAVLKYWPPWRIGLIEGST
jgi:signal peptidase I